MNMKKGSQETIRLTYQGTSLAIPELFPTIAFDISQSGSDDPRGGLPSSIIHALHLLRQITDDLHQRATVVGHQRSPKPARAPYNG
ncbi:MULTISPECIES: hypothetical protein [unclassified Bradyrhizobium]|uniref:hypothetical protein n=1 Tax=unclassified Bradyrhizobium TaxID=2631580 RepID=UPI00291674D2|nr:MULTISPECIES: hypothetical protein [unclassified Bradyrhizobium]